MGFLKDPSESLSSGSSCTGIILGIFQRSNWDSFKCRVDLRRRNCCRILPRSWWDPCRVLSRSFGVFTVRIFTRRDPFRALSRSNWDSCKILAGFFEDPSASLSPGSSCAGTVIGSRSNRDSFKCHVDLRRNGMASGLFQKSLWDPSRIPFEILWNSLRVFRNLSRSFQDSFEILAALSFYS